MLALSRLTLRPQPPLCRHRSKPLSVRVHCFKSDDRKARVRQQQVQDVQQSVAASLQSMQKRWSSVKNKPFVVSTGVVTVLAVSLSKAVLDAAERVPLLPDVLTLVGLVWSSAFFWRYILFADGRQELGMQVAGLRDKIIEQTEGAAPPRQAQPPAPPAAAQAASAHKPPAPEFPSAPEIPSAPRAHEQTAPPVLVPAGADNAPPAPGVPPAPLPARAPLQADIDSMGNSGSDGHMSSWGLPDWSKAELDESSGPDDN